jgi:hypothetical protein
MQFVHLDGEIGFDALDHEILADGLELVTDVRVVTLGTPFFLEEFEGLGEDLRGPDDGGVGGCGQAEVWSFEELGTACEGFVVW